MELNCANQATVRLLYQQLGPAAVSKTTYLVKDRQLAEDVVQDAFIKLMKKKPRFPCPEAAYCWVYRTCHNRGVDILRAASRSVTDMNIDELELKIPDSTDRRCENRQMVEVLAKRLGRDELRLLCYRAIDGLTTDEIAKLEGVSERSIRRSLSKLRTRAAALKEVCFG